MYRLDGSDVRQIRERDGDGDGAAVGVAVGADVGICQRSNHRIQPGADRIFIAVAHAEHGPFQGGKALIQGHQVQDDF